MPLIEEEIDGLSGLLFPFYDADTHMLYLAGKVVEDWGVGSAGAACWETPLPHHCAPAPALPPEESQANLSGRLSHSLRAKPALRSDTHSY